MSENASADPQPARRRGRPKGSTASATKKKITSAAAKEFAHVGFEAASLRSIARRAGVDPALVHHYFSDKSELFIQTMNIPVNPGKIIEQTDDAAIDDLGRALVTALLRTWDHPAFRAPAVAMVRGMISSNSAAKVLKPFVQREIFARIGARLPAGEAEQRVALAASQLLGLIVGRYILELEPLASQSSEQIIAWIAPTIQQYLTGELNEVPQTP